MATTYAYLVLSHDSNFTGGFREFDLRRQIGQLLQCSVKHVCIWLCEPMTRSNTLNIV